MARKKNRLLLPLRKPPRLKLPPRPRLLLPLLKLLLRLRPLPLLKALLRLPLRLLLKPLRLLRLPPLRPSNSGVTSMKKPAIGRLFLRPDLQRPANQAICRQAMPFS